MNTTKQKDLDNWVKKYLLFEDIKKYIEVFWTNQSYCNSFTHSALSNKDIDDAEKRLLRFASYIKEAFPEAKSTDGIIESPLFHIPTMKAASEKLYNTELFGSLWLKGDNLLPIAGSIKARGGIYEVLKHAETLALKHNLLSETDDYSILYSARLKDFFSNYSIAVGSTGNLGLSIGITSAKLGFKVTVHMSSDAKEWKKSLLREKGVTVIEYSSDYSEAVEEGRKLAMSNPRCHFIDDENSVDLFLGYSVAARRLEKQLKENNIVVDNNHPLFVYLPCGVGGGPGGVAFGLKTIFGENVHTFFSEPTHSPCMLLGLMTGMHDKVCVQDFGLDNITEADGLAVGRPSSFVGKILENLLSGIFTVDDNELYKLLKLIKDTENISLEPSALAGMPGPFRLLNSEAGKLYISTNNLLDKMKYSTHIVWSTGGNLVPQNIMDSYLKKGEMLLS
ncbi:D-serine ammonia-lyase [Brassicibacter mesophilus]|uniref:D-serine ammonia-lyase n=1 Tax=Brassicibacter mesophilus TaxID=745119 RepID=UPI003D248369